MAKTTGGKEKERSQLEKAGGRKQKYEFLFPALFRV